MSHAGRDNAGTAATTLQRHGGRRFELRAANATSAPSRGAAVQCERQRDLRDETANQDDSGGVGNDERRNRGSSGGDGDNDNNNTVQSDADAATDALDDCFSVPGRVDPDTDWPLDEQRRRKSYWSRLKATEGAARLLFYTTFLALPLMGWMFAWYFYPEWRSGVREHRRIRLLVRLSVVSAALWTAAFAVWYAMFLTFRNDALHALQVT